VVLHAVSDVNVGCLKVNRPTSSSTETVFLQLADMMLTQSCTQQIHWHTYVVVNDGKACSAFFVF